MDPEKIERPGMIAVSEQDIAFYFYGMCAMPPNVQRHLQLCRKHPAECLLCLMVRRKIEAAG